MSVIKQIDYVDGGYHYNTAEVIEYKDYVVVKLMEIKNGEVIRESRSVWFALDNLPFELTEDEIAGLQKQVGEDVSD